MNQKDFDEDVSRADLDITGANVDDDKENSGNEDEENHHYNIGGEDRANLEEMKAIKFS